MKAYAAQVKETLVVCARIPLLVSFDGEVLINCPFVDISLSLVVIIVHMVNAAELVRKKCQQDV